MTDDTWRETPFGMPWPEQDRLAGQHLNAQPAHRMIDMREDGGSLWCWTCKNGGGVTTDVDGPGGAGPDLDELLRLAEAATPGPWETVEVDDGRFYGQAPTFDVVSLDGGRRELMSSGGILEDGGPNIGAMEGPDAKFIAAASPDVVAALVGRVRAAEAEAERHRQSAKLWFDTNEANCAGLKVERDDALRIAERYRAENDKLRAELRREESAHNWTCEQRDAAHEAADTLAYTVAPQSVIGEHSSANDPWANAVNAALATHERGVRAEAERDAARAEVETLTHELSSVRVDLAAARAELAAAQAELDRWNEIAAVAHDRDVELADAHRALAKIKDEIRAEADQHAVDHPQDQRFRDGMTHIWAKFLVREQLLAASRPSSLADTTGEPT